MRFRIHPCIVDIRRISIRFLCVFLFVAIFVLRFFDRFLSSLFFSLCCLQIFSLHGDDTVSLEWFFVFFSEKLHPVSVSLSLKLLVHVLCSCPSLFLEFDQNER